ncbi:MAG: 2-amino-4-hydroxy-6-hydroxymethyldihydropteridine diphosphokinase [Sphingobium sp.]
MADTSRLYLYVLALGSNRALSAWLTPLRLLDAAATTIGAEAGTLIARAPTLASAPLGPARRRYANSALLVESALHPDALLRLLQTIETRFGRQRRRRWGERRLDIDIILWSGGRWSDRRLTIPHIGWRKRDFVLVPVVQIAPRWYDPVTGLNARQLLVRLRKGRVVDHRRAAL